MRRCVVESKPRILFFDIETAGVNALKSDLGFCIMVGYKWAGEKDAKIVTIARKDLKAFNDGPLLTKFSAIYNKADITVAHFGSVFDRRFIQGRLLINNLPAIPFTRMRDTCMIARSVANYSSNRLKHLCKILDLSHQKLENNWPTAWFKAMQGDMSHIAALAKYCKGDVLALEALYYKLLPFDNAHPRIYFPGESGAAVCGHCGSDRLHHRGVAYIGGGKFPRFQCTACGKWGRGRKSVK